MPPQTRPAAGRPAETQVFAAASEQTPLSPAELEQMNQLLARASQVQSPSTRPGDPYVALINLNVPRRGTDPLRGSDLVMAGDTVNLTPEEAAGYMRHGPGDGRRIPVVRPAAGPKSSSDQQRVPPRAVSGAIRQPTAPPPGSDLPMPDPAGSSAILQQEGVPPEGQEPVPGSENSSGAPESSADLFVSAEDIIPERTRARAAAAAQAGR